MHRAMSGTEQTLNICSHGYCFLKIATLTEFLSTATRQPHSYRWEENRKKLVQSTTFSQALSHCSWWGGRTCCGRVSLWSQTARVQISCLPLASNGIMMDTLGLLQGLNATSHMKPLCAGHTLDTWKNRKRCWGWNKLCSEHRQADPHLFQSAKFFKWAEKLIHIYTNDLRRKSGF